jgi:hypothetical protein
MGRTGSFVDCERVAELSERSLGTSMVAFFF